MNFEWQALALLSLYVSQFLLQIVTFSIHTSPRFLLPLSVPPFTTTVIRHWPWWISLNPSSTLKTQSGLSRIAMSRIDTSWYHLHCYLHQISLTFLGVPLLAIQGGADWFWFVWTCTEMGRDARKGVIFEVNWHGVAKVELNLGDFYVHIVCEVKITLGNHFARLVMKHLNLGHFAPKLSQFFIVEHFGDHRHVRVDESGPFNNAHLSCFHHSAISVPLKHYLIAWWYNFRSNVVHDDRIELK